MIWTDGKRLTEVLRAGGTRGSIEPTSSGSSSASARTVEPRNGTPATGVLVAVEPSAQRFGVAYASHGVCLVSLSRETPRRVEE